jgi:DNA repair protein RadC
MDEHKKSIKHWSEQDQPREKLMAGGAGALSDSELIAILLVTGIKNQSAIDVARNLLGSVQHDLSALSGLSLKELKKIKGIGEAKAITILAALELGRRRSNLAPKLKTKITSAKEAASIFDELKYSKQEEFWVACLNQAMQVTHVTRVHIGGITAVVADPRIIYKVAIEQHAAAIIVAHNHPSGSTRPSQQDEKMTNKLKVAGEILDIKLSDHIIIAETGYYSFADEGML